MNADRTLPEVACRIPPKPDRVGHVQPGACTSQTYSPPSSLCAAYSRPWPLSSGMSTIQRVPPMRGKLPLLSSLTLQSCSSRHLP